MEIFDDVFVDHEYEYIYKFIYYMYLLCSLQPLISTTILYAHSLVVLAWTSVTSYAELCTSI